MKSLIDFGSKGESNAIRCYILIEFLLLIAAEIALAYLGVIELRAFRYGNVLLNTFIAGIWFFRYGRQNIKCHANILCYGLFMTTLADVFLTLLDTNALYLYGFICFCIVELIYAIYLKTSLQSYLIRLGIYIAALIIFILSGQATIPYAVGLLNIVLVLTNAITSWTTKRMDVPLLFKIGITLFFLCDISIVIQAVTSGVTAIVFDYLIWIFYAPSQVLITLCYVMSVSKTSLLTTERKTH